MTYHSDPTRWTESPGDAPELLRGAFQAGADEGPTEHQMRSLALKLAVVGSGAAVLTSASVASAAAAKSAAGGALAATGGGAVTAAAASGGAFTAVKLAAVSLAVIGAAATGAVMMKEQPTTRSAQPARTRVVQTAAPSREVEEAPAATVQEAPAVEQDVARARPAANPERTPAPTSREAALRDERDIETSETRGARSEQRESAREERRARRRAARSAAREARRLGEESLATPVRSVPLDLERTTPGPSEQPAARGAGSAELQLLQSARAVLGSRPRAALELAEQHRSTYPDGIFAQERDALAIEALLRTGDLGEARSRAESFIERYPSSPHAHRFRETMNIQ